MKSRASLAALILGTVVVASGSTRGADCAAREDVQFVCGVVSPEDLVALPGIDWVLASGYTGGPLVLINTQDFTTTPLFPTENPRAKLDAKTYKGCPGPIDPNEKDKFSAHGINVRRGSGGVHTLYVVHHGFRESIEVFEIDTKSKVPALTWIGCVVAPETATFNSVAPLADGGFVATNPYRRTDPDARARAQAGSNSGEVWEWHANSGWTVVPESESPGPNGIEVSRDGSWLYINLWPVSKVMRLSRGQTPVKKDIIDVSFHPDNIRWQADGSLLTAGHYAPTMERSRECLRMPCDDAAAKVARLNPNTLKVEEVVNYPSNEVFFGATAALQVGREIWIGSVRGDRIARYPSR
jgi:hypothetical protein